MLSLFLTSIVALNGIATAAAQWSLVPGTGEFGTVYYDAASRKAWTDGRVAMTVKTVKVPTAGCTLADCAAEIVATNVFACAARAGNIVATRLADKNGKHLGGFEIGEEAPTPVDVSPGTVGGYLFDRACAREAMPMPQRKST
jgi:hypothetical protein